MTNGSLPNRRIVWIRWCIASLLTGLCGCVAEPPPPQHWDVADPTNAGYAGMTWQEAYTKYRRNPADSAAAQAVRDAAAANPSDENAQYAVGIVERDCGRWDEAEAAFRRIIERNPNRPGAMWNLGRLAVRKGELESAAALFEQARKISPKAWQPIYALGQLRRQQGEIEKANFLWQEAKQLGAGETDQRGGMDGYEAEIGMVVKFLEWD